MADTGEGLCQKNRAGEGGKAGGRGQRSGAVCHPPPGGGGGHTPSKSQRKKLRSFLTLKLLSHIHQSHIKCLIIQ